MTSPLSTIVWIRKVHAQHAHSLDHSQHMPKQRNRDFKHLQGSTSKAVHQGNDSNDETRSVTHRLNQLRLADQATANAKKRELADAVNQPTVPPILQDILGRPQTAAPKPRRQIRCRDMRRPPGPAIPSSWLEKKPRELLPQNATLDTDAALSPYELFRFEKLCRARTDVDGPSTLLHSSLRTIAEQSPWFTGDDYEVLKAMPPKARIELVSYIGFYGQGISIDNLKILLADAGPITSLDLAGLLGQRGLTLKQLTKLLKESDKPAVQQDTAESWDAEDGVVAVGSIDFSNLTHLCLSHPPSTTLWQDLLDLTKYTPALTHLSLAYWPRPTLTPNLATTTVANKYGPDVSAGGSHHYSELDQDYAEPHAMFRRLSRNLLRLQWLDIEGRPQWLRALEHTAHRQPGWQQERDQDRSLPILAGNWKNLTYVRCAQSFLPYASWPALPLNGADICSRSSDLGYNCQTRHRSALLVSLRFLYPGQAELHDTIVLQMASNDAKSLSLQHSEVVRCINRTRLVFKCPRITFDTGVCKAAFI